MTDIEPISDARLAELTALHPATQAATIGDMRTTSAASAFFDGAADEWPAILARLRKAEAERDEAREAHERTKNNLGNVVCERDRYRALVLFMRASFNKPASAHSMLALDTLFEMLRDKIDAFDADPALKEPPHG